MILKNNPITRIRDSLFSLPRNFKDFIKEGTNLQLPENIQDAHQLRDICAHTVLQKKKYVASSTAQVFQFRVVACFTATTHKFQAWTIVKPNTLAVDLRTFFEDVMAYVMLSRVQDVNQLFIVGQLSEEKFRTNFKCLEELKRLSDK